MIIDQRPDGGNNNDYMRKVELLMNDQYNDRTMMAGMAATIGATGKIVGRMQGKLDGVLGSLGEGVKALLDNMAGTEIFNRLEGLDQGIRNISLETGISQENSALMRDNIEAASNYATRLGLSFDELLQLTQASNQALGRASEMSTRNLQALSEISAITQLSADEIATMNRQFTLMQRSSVKTRDFLVEAMDNAEMMGINAQRVITEINENFKQAQRYNFKEGVRSLEQMAQYSEKMGVSIKSTFDTMDQASTLEGALEMATQLQMMGGKFANTDALDLMYKAQYDPEGFQKFLTEGLRSLGATYKDADGTLQINQVSKQMLKYLERQQVINMGFDEMQDMILKSARIDEVGQVLGGSGLSRQMIEQAAGMATMNQGRYGLEVLENGERVFRSLEELMRDGRLEDELTRYRKNIQQNDAAGRAVDALGLAQSVESGMNTFAAGLSDLAENINLMLDEMRRQNKTDLEAMREGNLEMQERMVKSLLQGKLQESIAGFYQGAGVPGLIAAPLIEQNKQAIKEFMPEFLELVRSEFSDIGEAEGTQETLTETWDAIQQLGSAVDTFVNEHMFDLRTTIDRLKEAVVGKENTGKQEASFSTAGLMGLLEQYKSKASKLEEQGFDAQQLMQEIRNALLKFNENSKKPVVLDLPDGKIMLQVDLTTEIDGEKVSKKVVKYIPGQLKQMATQGRP